MRVIRNFVMAVAVFASSVTIVHAHHSYAAFDKTRQETVKGTVRKLEWTNPHVWLWIDAVDEKSQVVAYGFESVSPAQLQRDYGWNKNILRAGEKVSIDYAPLRNGKPGGELMKVTLENGRVLATRYAKGSEPTTNAGSDEQKKP